MGSTIRRVEFTGSSDDIISVHKVTQVEYSDAIGDSISEDDDEIYASSNGNTRLKVSNLGGSRVCIVTAIYDGCWSFAVGMIEEERKIPPWVFTIDQPEHKYSTRLIIESGEDDLIIEREDGEDE